MNRNQKIVEVMHREVFWFLIGFGVAGGLAINLGLSGWAAGHSALLGLVIGVCILVSGTFGRVRTAKQR